MTTGVGANFSNSNSKAFASEPNSKSFALEPNVGFSMEISFIVVSLALHHFLFALIRSFIRCKMLRQIFPKSHICEAYLKQKSKPLFDISLYKVRREKLKVVKIALVYDLKVRG